MMNEAAIIKSYQDGMSLAEISRLEHVTVDMVRKVLNITTPTVAKRISQLEARTLGPMKDEIKKMIEDLETKKRRYSDLQQIYNELTDSDMDLEPWKKRGW